MKARGTTARIGRLRYDIHTGRMGRSCKVYDSNRVWLHGMPTATADPRRIRRDIRVTLRLWERAGFKPPAGSV